MKKKCFLTLPQKYSSNLVTVSGDVSSFLRKKVYLSAYLKGIPWWSLRVPLRHGLICFLLFRIWIEFKIKRPNSIGVLKILFVMRKMGCLYCILYSSKSYSSGSFSLQCFLCSLVCNSSDTCSKLPLMIPSAGETSSLYIIFLFLLTLIIIYNKIIFSNRLQSLQNNFIYNFSVFFKI